MRTPHRVVNPHDLMPAVGFSHAVAAARGELVVLGGQTGHRADESIDLDLVDQFAQACRSVAIALEAVGGEPEHVISLMIYVVGMEEYRERLEEIGRAYRQVFGKHYPAMALLGAAELLDPAARVELVAVAVVPRS